MSELEREPSLRRNMLGRMAKLAEKLGDKAGAEQAWQARLRTDGDDLEALDALIRGAAEQERWAQLAALLERRIGSSGGSAQRREDLVWLAGTYADRLGDAGAAIEVWRRIVAVFGEDTESLAALTELLSRAERWRELADVLSHAAARQIARFTDLQTRLGDAYRERLDQPELAAQRYRSALQVEPRDEAALRGQRALVADDRCRALAIESLAEAYERSSDWKKTLELLEARLSIQNSDSARAELLLRAAELHEQRADDARAALDCLRRAFTLAPDDRPTEKEIRRLAERLGAWDAVVATYRETIASFPKPTFRVAELRYDEGRTLEERLGDREGALTAYADAAAIAGDRLELAVAAARMACALGRFDEAARHVVACARARSEVGKELLGVLESAAAAGRSWDALCDGMSGALQATTDLDSKLARELHTCVARWQQEKRGDENAAEAALLLATRADDRDVDTLRALARLQRRAPGEPLCTTLLALADLDRQDLDALYEAAQVAADALPERDQRLSIWSRLFDRASDMLRVKGQARGETDAATAARFAVDQLVSALSEAGAPARALSLLSLAGTLPFSAEQKREDLLRAARIAAGPLADAERASALYRELLLLEPGNRVAIVALGQIYRAAAHLPELLSLKRHELSLEPEADKQLALRLEISGTLGELEALGGRLKVLEDNLRGRPGHPLTLQAVEALLLSQRRHGELAELLRGQARQLARQGAAAQAAGLLERVAVLHERDLDDVDAALEAYTELHELEPAGNASAALARIYKTQGQHALSAKWLELRLQTAPPDTRAVTAVELAQALLQAGERPRARACLEQALHEEPSLREARELLAGVYRDEQAYEPLAGLLVDATEHEAASERKLALLREAAALYFDTLHTPERAVPALERARARQGRPRAASEARRCADRVRPLRAGARRVRTLDRRLRSQALAGASRAALSARRRGPSGWRLAARVRRARHGNQDGSRSHRGHARARGAERAARRSRPCRTRVPQPLDARAQAQVGRRPEGRVERDLLRALVDRERSRSARTG